MNGLSHRLQKSRGYGPGHTAAMEDGLTPLLCVIGLATAVVVKSSPVRLATLLKAVTSSKQRLRGAALTDGL